MRYLTIMENGESIGWITLTSAMKWEAFAPSGILLATFDNPGDAAKLLIDRVTAE